MKRSFRKTVLRLALVVGVAVGSFLLGALAVGYYLLGMPGHSYRGALPPLSEPETALRDALRRDVEMLARTIGARNVWNAPRQLDAAAGFLETSLTTAGWTVRRDEYQVNGKTVANLEVQSIGKQHPEQIILVGGHYDSVVGCPGADDNATAVAAVLALGRQFAGRPTGKTLRLVLFVNEEPPCFQNPDMGSWVYAKRCRARGDQIAGMIALDGLGYYSDQPGSQHYPPPFDRLYPDTGNFIALVGNPGSRAWLHQVIGAFRRHARFPSEGGVAPESVSPMVGFSDHWSFWQEGYPGIMVTDTLPVRNPYYHTAQDTPEHLDYDRLARMVAGLQMAVEELVGKP